MPKTPQWDELPAETRQRIHEARRKEIAQSTPKVPGCRRWQCVACGAISNSWAAAERHADEFAHHRIDLLLDPE